MSSLKVIERANMRKYGVIFEVEVNGVRLCRKDGTPRRFLSNMAVRRAGIAELGK